ncbi:hypothetical protein GQ466_16850 [Actinomadura rayongensis]|uniref:MFS transporter n=1 Tax=Actinomadura rayongensis TaxID=1429076 RepID=A0A6I4W7V3_9ACTN|nr:hypothetical protein [Actinomadura rayongensis]
MLASRVISSASTGFGQLALTWDVMGLGYGPRKLALVLACNTCPALLILLGGVVGDRFPRHRVLLAAETLAALVWTCIGAVTLSASGHFAYCVPWLHAAAVAGTAATELGPAWAAADRGILCGASASLLSRLATSRPRRADSNPLQDMREGWHEFRTHP